jgi:two-component system response regulator AdeR
MLTLGPIELQAAQQPPRGRTTMGGMPQILIVEDEPEIAKILEMYLQGSGYETERAANGRSALELLHLAKPDLVLLDVMLPELDGIEVLKAIRQRGRTPVIMLTAKGEELDQLLGLELGADDYISKPFRPREVVARIKAVLRRSQPAPTTPTRLTLGGLELDGSEMSAYVDGRALSLTATEFRLLYHLLRFPRRAFPRFELLHATLPESDALERVVDTHLANIRRKLKGTSAEASIVTVHGVGYKFVPHE